MQELPNKAHYSWAKKDFSVTSEFTLRDLRVRLFSPSYAPFTLREVPFPVPS
jgi:hypothetical protein